MTTASVLEPVHLFPGDPSFPKALLTVRPQPDWIYALGDLAVLEEPMVAIVGSRDPTLYGTRVAYEAAHAMARAGLVVVSGMARGLDARAHRGALDAGGRTVGVLGCGIDVGYPRENRDLLEAVPRHGLLISECEPGARPSKFTFPKRNRLIAALAKCLLVVEGKIKGGTTNTVEWMQKLNKTIFAVPGRIGDLTAEGPNLLLHQGAHVYLSPRDVLVEYGRSWVDPLGEHAGAATAAAAEAGTELSGAEALVFDLVTPQPMHVDRLAERAALEPGLLLAALSSLEVQGLITQLPGKHFALAS